MNIRKNIRDLRDVVFIFSTTWWELRNANL